MARWALFGEVPERFLRQLWLHQRFATTLLHTSDNRRVEILSVGTPNLDSGPDFKNARIRIGDILYRGDVELHQHAEDWKRHSHHTDPGYNGVILHVVFRGDATIIASQTQAKRTIPVLILEHYLTLSFRELWELMIRDERSERLSTIKCYDVNDGAEAQAIRKWLVKLSIERIELKMRRFEERLKELIEKERLVLNEPPRYGEIPFGLNPEDLPPPVHSYTKHEFGKPHLWEQLLYEGMMEALGYSKNQEPFLHLARNVRLQWMFEMLSNVTPAHSSLNIEAILFGASGLLKMNRGDDTASKEHIQSLKSLWAEYRKFYKGETNDRSEWQFFRLRPDNFPTVRLAGASRLIARMQKARLLKSLVQTLKNPGVKSKAKYDALLNLFIVESDGFWESHYRFGEPAGKPLTKLIGKSRADEIIQNVVIPVCFLYARIFKDKDVRKATLDIFEHCLPSGENSITTTIAEQLVKEKFKLDSAQLQQGALQLYKFYCSQGRCDDCAVGKVVFKV